MSSKFHATRLATFAGLAGLALAAGVASAGNLNAPPSLKTVVVPKPDNLRAFVRSEFGAKVLGKALFWDMQVGSDGQACASCHFAAGADPRSKHQLNPGSKDLGPPANQIINVGGANYQLQLSDFPTHRLADVNDRQSLVLFDTDDVTSSQGVFPKNFLSVLLGNANDLGSHVDEPVFNVAGTEVRRVEPRNTPTVINAVFNFRQFWDGRANHFFNGSSPFGPNDPKAQIVVTLGGNTFATGLGTLLNKASLASQAVGPVLSTSEESFAGRIWPDVGKKMLSLPPLALQLVDPSDSLLGIVANSGIVPNTNGLWISYADLIKFSFPSYFWNTTKIVKVVNGLPQILDNPGRPLFNDEYTFMEYNFSMIFGLAVQLYESTLVADDTAFDQFQEGNDAALTPQQQEGLELFISSQAKCINCHGGSELTNASQRNVRNDKIEWMVFNDGGIAAYDNGFYNIGVRPHEEDVGVGGKDPFGNPLSFTRLAQQGREFPPVDPKERISVVGNFKVPGLRNVELTAPYFHNGGQATLRQVVEFYNRGGDFHEHNNDPPHDTLLDPDITNLGLTDVQKDALVAFLQSLTDERVRYQRAPFDHPQLFIPNGHPGDQNSVTDDGTGQATDGFVEIQAVGAAGGAPLPSFLQ